MMKKYIISAALLLSGLYSFGQNVNKLIKEDDVRRVINTLAADDMQGRATFTPGIEKAARFIEGEFSAAGLEPLTGNSDFRQNFKMTRTTPVNSQAKINDVTLPADHVVVLSSTGFVWINDPEVKVVKVTAGQNLIAEYRSVRRNGAKKTLVLVDPSFEATFSQLRNQLGRGSTTLKPTTSGPQVVLVLGTFDDAKAFNISSEVKSEQLPLFNIAGMIKGKTRPDEYVIFSGH